ncbi:MAG: hypothetical protein IKT14_05180 [Clostridiales bacterium]|nr:hypothetical protein [Clostridiales bacterium]
MKSKIKVILVCSLGVLFFLFAVAFIYSTRAYLGRAKNAASDIDHYCDHYSISGVVERIEDATEAEKPSR